LKARLLIYANRFHIKILTLNILFIQLSSTSTISQKAKAWKNIEEKFNGQTPRGIIRTSRQLRKAYENMKWAAKKIKAAQNREKYITGGGPLPNPNKGAEELLGLINDNYGPLQNPYDDDASMQGDNPVAEVVNVEQIHCSSSSSRQTENSSMRPKILNSSSSASTRLMEMEEEEHKLRMEYWRLKIDYIKRKSERLG